MAWSRIDWINRSTELRERALPVLGAIVEACIRDGIIVPADRVPRYSKTPDLVEAARRYLVEVEEHERAGAKLVRKMAGDELGCDN